MDSENYQILSQRLETTGVSEIEDMFNSSNSITKELQFKEGIALLVLVSAALGDPKDDRVIHFRELNRRLDAIFRSITSENSAESRPETDSQPNQSRETESRPNAAVASRPTFSKISYGADAVPAINWQFFKSHVDSRHGFSDAMVHLVLSDASACFAQFAVKHNYSLIEAPCFLEMARYSSVSNRNKFQALLGEYIALLGFCFFKGHFTDSQYRTATSDFDFVVRRRRTDTTFAKQNVSVKTVKFHGVTHFSDAKDADLYTGETNQSSETGANRNKKTAKKKKKEKKTSIFVSGDSCFADGEYRNSNVLLNNCGCDVCTAEPVREVKVEYRKEPPRKHCIKGLNNKCKSHEKFKRLLKKLEFGVVYLVSVRLFFELRYALDTFKQSAFRGTKTDFKLRDLISDYLASLATGNVAGDTEKWLPTLVDRSPQIQI